jgi:hypothetical protein
MNLQSKIFSVLIVLFLFFACRDKTTRAKIIDISQNTIVLDNSELLYSFDDVYPVSVSVKDSFVYVIRIQSDTCIIVLDIRTKQIICKFGIKGRGPNDIINPYFISSINSADVLLEDASVKRIMNINTKNFSLEKHIEYPDKIFPSGETNISDCYIVGRRIGKEEMFYIFDRHSDSINIIKCYPAISNLKHDPSYIYSTTLAMNEEKENIIAGMYLMDMFQLYDLKGTRLGLFAFSENYIPEFDSNDLMSDIQKCSAGITRSFPTKDYCYLLRIAGNRLTDNLQHMIIQLKWNGEFIRAYKFKDQIEGQFYVDEKDGKLYAIKHIITPEQTELFEVVRYQLLKNDI